MTSSKKDFGPQDDEPLLARLKEAEETTQASYNAEDPKTLLAQGEMDAKSDRNGEGLDRLERAIRLEESQYYSEPPS